MLYGVPGIRIRRRNVRKIRFPQDVIDADEFPHFDAHCLEPEINVDLPSKELARTRENSFPPELALFPFAVACFQNRDHPAQAGLRKHPTESGKSIEQAGED